MLKKLVFVGALLLFSGAVYAAKPGSGYDTAKVDWEEWDGNANMKAESWNWPAEYKYQTIVTIPVKMDIGFWVRVKAHKDLVLKLHQDAIRKYSGSLEVAIECNVSIQLKLDFVKAAGMPNIEKDWATVTPSVLDPTGGTVVISLGVKNVDLKGFSGQQVGTNIEIGYVTLQVRPNVTPQLAGAC